MNKYQEALDRLKSNNYEMESLDTNPVIIRYIGKKEDFETLQELINKYEEEENGEK